MKVTVVGLGLIGGSLARAMKENTDYTVYGDDKDTPTVLAALAAGAIDARVDDEKLADSDAVMISLYPEAIIEYLEKNADIFKKSAVVMDTCGVKRVVCEKAFRIAEEHGFFFIGAHPMAGTQYSGFAHSRSNMFKGATMIMCHNENADIPMIEKAKETVMPIGFANVHFVSAEEHDSMIAFTSQLAHIVSNAYVKSPRSLSHKGFSAGSYKDLTRVAQLNPEMWTELFLDNSDNITRELDVLIENLKKYNDAIKRGDAESLCRELREGSDIKVLAEKS